MATWVVWDMRRSYDIVLRFNGKTVTKVIIDLHFEKKHASSINDRLILDLVKMLDGEVVVPVEISGQYSYFVRDRIEFEGKCYRLIWLTEESEIYIGVINAFRRT